MKLSLRLNLPFLALLVLAVLAIVAAGCKLFQRTAQVESTGTSTSPNTLQFTADGLL
jgi:hypothetical protein